MNTVKRAKSTMLGKSVTEVAVLLNIKKKKKKKKKKKRHGRDIEYVIHIIM